MQVELEVLEAQVLKLSPEDRARLLDRLILSLDEDKVRDAAWDELAAQRDEEIETGRVAEIDGPEALARLRAKYG
jgi:Putative addiction module component